MVTNLQRVGIFIKAELAIAGNTFEALRNIVRIRSETRPTLMDVYTPPLITKNIKIMSK
jgi:predicted Zn-dependent protease